MTPISYINQILFEISLICKYDSNNFLVIIIQEMLCTISTFFVSYKF